MMQDLFTSDLDVKHLLTSIEMFRTFEVRGLVTVWCFLATFVRGRTSKLRKSLTVVQVDTNREIVS